MPMSCEESPGLARLDTDATRLSYSHSLTDYAPSHGRPGGGPGPWGEFGTDAPCWGEGRMGGATERQIIRRYREGGLIITLGQFRIKKFRTTFDSI